VKVKENVRFEIGDLKRRRGIRGWREFGEISPGKARRINRMSHPRGESE